MQAHPGFAFVSTINGDQWWEQGVDVETALDYRADYREETDDLIEMPRCCAEPHGVVHCHHTRLPRTRPGMSKLRNALVTLDRSAARLGEHLSSGGPQTPSEASIRTVAVSLMHKRAHLVTVTDNQTVARDAGTLRLSVWYVGDVPDEDGGARRQYGYRIESTDPDARAMDEGEDLHSGVGAPVDADAAVRTLASFLSAAGEAYRYALDHPDTDPENLDLFPPWVAEVAYLNADELTMLAAEEELLDHRTDGDQRRAARYVSVVFQQGDDAAETLAILDEHGSQAGVDHLAQWDFGRETEEAAEVYDGVHDQPPAGASDHIHVSGEYVMTYNHAHGHVGLVRRLDPPDDTARSSVDVPVAPESQHRRRRPIRAMHDPGRDAEPPWSGPAGPSGRTDRSSHPPPGL